jgi:hypothetical protein
LNPILSRFCEICVPEYTDENGNTINLHQYNLNKKFDFVEYEDSKKEWLNEHMENAICIQEMKHNHLLDLVNTMYENGYSCLDLVEWLKQSTHEKWNDLQKSNIIMHYQSRKSEFRCEKMLLFHLLDILFFSQNTI